MRASLRHLSRHVFYPKTRCTSRTFSAHAASSNGVDDEAESFREQVHDFAQRVIAPHAASIDATNSFPTSVNLWREMGDFGLHGLTSPAEYGGLALGYRFHCIAMEVCCIGNQATCPSTIQLGVEPGLWLCCAVLRRPQQPVHQSTRPQWQRAAAPDLPP